ncbi:flavodoxin domain-containing protein [Pseudooceanicola marinus]|uniref:flavodoxin domain-containing protein n=1 Tax=Pseudooceanicola marinus TaxID=396013 RepID=UPI001CD6DDE8|nr:flavodoxin domain-containing protein [Pseudooceanicola marinus]MCA1336804.1 flavodoxin domain-containing protein [Pseudooceanicola marinus]
MKIAIYYGTETGNAEMLAEDIATELEDAHETSVADLAETAPEALKAAELNVIVCSSYDDGDFPASAKPFVEKLNAESPDLSGVRFAIFGLGDSEYEATYGFGSMKLADLLVARGATTLGERIVHDAAGDDLPEDLALPWLAGILETA